MPISIITIIFGLYNSPSLERISRHTIQQYKESTYYLSYRHELHILTAYQMFLDKKFFGHGLKSFRNLCSSPKYAIIIEGYKEKSINRVVANTKNISDQENLIVKIKNAVACNTHPHNIYLEFLAELGIIGFIFLLFLFLYVLRKFLIYYLIIIATKKENNIVYGRYFILLGFLISMIPLIPSGSYFNNYMLIITYFPIGFYLSTKRNIHSSKV